ncbi:hypothetical protein Tco_0331745 [Tanacetum coccineum]
MRPAKALTAIQTMADHSQKWLDAKSAKDLTSTRIVPSSRKLNKWKRSDIGNLDEQRLLTGIMEEDKPWPKHVTTLAKEAVTKIDNNEDCKAIFINDGAPLYTLFYYSPKEIEYFLANFGFLDDDELNNVTSIPDEDLKQTSLKPTTTHYVEPYIPPIPFPRRLEQHVEEALIYKTMESLKKIKSNRPFLKEIRQSNEYPKFMKDLVANKPLTMENEDTRINRRCSALLLNQLPPKEKDPGSFILPFLIGRLDFNNASGDVGASISIMPFSMYKRLELLIKIDKFILPIDFIILDVLEDFRMPIILGRSMLTTAHAKIDVFKRSISLEVGNEKVIFKLRNDLHDMKSEYVLMIQSNIITEGEEYEYRI